MPEHKEQLEAFLQFIKERRSDESKFGELHEKLEETIQALREDTGSNVQYLQDLEEVNDKQAIEFIQAKERTDSAWPEFEKFVTNLERSTTEALKEA